MKKIHQILSLFALLFFIGCNTDNDLQGKLQLPKPEFTADQRAVKDGIPVQFQDQSEGALGWKWNFGDGTPEVFEQNPIHSYSYAGSYTVQLTVWNKDGENTVSKSNYITVDGPEKEKPELKEVFSYSVKTTTTHDIKGLPGFVGDVYINDSLYISLIVPTLDINIPNTYFTGEKDRISFKGEWTDDAKVLSIGDNNTPNKDIVALHTVADIKTFFARHLSVLKVIDEDLFAESPELKNLNGAFRNCSALEEIPAQLFKNNSEITNFKHVFADCNFQVIPKGLFDTTTKVTTFSSAFNNNKSLAIIPDGLFDACKQVTDFSYAFYKNSNIKVIPAHLFDSNIEVTTFEGVFAACDLSVIPNDFFKHNTKVKSFKSVFNLNTRISTVPTTLFDYCPEVTSFEFAFYGCSSLTNAPALWEKSFSKLNSAAGCFRNCTNLVNFNSIPNTWK